MNCCGACQQRKTTRISLANHCRAKYYGSWYYGPLGQYYGYADNFQSYRDVGHCGDIYSPTAALLTLPNPTLDNWCRY